MQIPHAPLLSPTTMMESILRFLRWLCRRVPYGATFQRVFYLCVRLAGLFTRFLHRHGCTNSLKSSGTSHSTGTIKQPSSRAVVASESVPTTHVLASRLPSSQPSGTDNKQQNLPSFVRPALTVPTPRSLPKPIAPEQFRRHEHRQSVERRTNMSLIQQGQIDYTEKVPDQWKCAVHPDGARYFYSMTKGVFTDTNLLDPDNIDELDVCIQYLRHKEQHLFSPSAFQTCSSLTQLVIQAFGSGEWGYYFVAHDTEVIFWVDDFDAADLMQDLEGVTENSHIKYVIEAQYWLHCEQYPNCIPLSQTHVTKLWGEMSHAYADVVTAKTSLCTYDQNQLAQLSSLMPYLQTRIGSTDEYAMWISARLMGNFAYIKFYNFYGQLGTRLESNLSVYSQTNEEKEQLLVTILDYLLFSALSLHLAELKAIWVDDIINLAQWKSFASKLRSEWSNFTIYSTVMLAVDVSFLAIPTVDGGNISSQSVDIIATYMSLLSVVGSLLSSVLLARQSGTQDESAVHAATFMYQMTRWRGGLIALGVMYSLPYALLVWAMIYFVLALFYTIFKTTNHVSLSIMVCGAVGIAIVMLLPVWWGHDYDNWLLYIKDKFQRRRDVESV